MSDTFKISVPSSLMDGLLTEHCRQYLTAHGWRDSGYVREWFVENGEEDPIQWWTRDEIADEPMAICVPKRDDYADHRNRIFDIVRTCAHWEKRSQFEVLMDLRAVSSLPRWWYL